MPAVHYCLQFSENEGDSEKNNGETHGPVSEIKAEPDDEDDKDLVLDDDHSEVGMLGYNNGFVYLNNLNNQCSITVTDIRWRG